MKLKTGYGLFLGLLVVVLAVNTAPARATDFSGYVEALYGTHWRVEGFWVRGTREIAGGTACRFICQHYAKNIGGVLLTEAILLIEIMTLQYIDESGNVISVTDPVELRQLIRIENSEEMLQDSYVVWLGTIKPGHSKRFTLNFWVDVDWFSIGGHRRLWYIP